MKPRIAFVGGGGIGSFSAAHMTKAGEDVLVIDGYPKHVEHIRTKELNVSGLVPRDQFSIRLNAMHVSDVQQLAKQRPIDIAFITMKSYDTPWAASLIKPYLATNGFVASLQNAINEEAVAGVVGWGKTLGVVIAGMSMELYAPGHVKRTMMGKEGHIIFRCGEVHGRETPRSAELARLMSYVDAAKVTTNLWGERWSKLIGNTMRNAISSITGIGGAEQDTNDTIRWIMIRLGSEAVRVGQASGYELVIVQGMEPDTLGRAGEGDETALAEINHVMLDNSKRRMDDSRPSMAQDIAKGRRTEIDHMNGVVATKGREMGIPTPVNSRIVELTKQLERGELKPGIEAVRDI